MGVWKRANLLKPEKTWQLWKKITKKLVWIPLTVKVKKARNTRNNSISRVFFCSHDDTTRPPTIIIYILLYHLFFIYIFLIFSISCIVVLYTPLLHNKKKKMPRRLCAFFLYI